MLEERWVGRVVERSVVQTVDRITVFIARLTQWWLEGRLIHVHVRLNRCMTVGRVVERSVKIAFLTLRMMLKMIVT